MSKLVLIVDDDPMNRELIEAFLTRGGYSTQSAATGTQALTMLANGTSSPALILLDARLGDPDGFEVCARLKRDPATQVIPILMLSASKLAKDIQHAEEVGADGYYHKPDGWQGLMERVAELIG
ncbi:MAG: response regulator [Chloroflexota bacterium]|nr:response regulator [Chloroflexota bacterium]